MGEPGKVKKKDTSEDTVRFYNCSLFYRYEKRTKRQKTVKLRVRVDVLDSPISFFERRECGGNEKGPSNQMYLVQLF